MIGKKEIDETVDFLESVMVASGADWGDKLATWREGQYGTVEDDLREWCRRYSEQQVMMEVLTQLKEELEGTYENYEHAVYEGMKRISLIAVVQGITIGLELQRRYGGE